MNRILRAVSIVLPVVGLGYICFYIFFGSGAGVDKLGVFSQPSYYYVEQNNKFAYLAGIIVLICGVLACFFAWLKKMDTGSGALPNAVSANQDEITTWVGSSSLADGSQMKRVSGTGYINEYGDEDGTEVLPEYYEDGTEVLPEYYEDETEILEEEYDDFQDGWEDKV